ncbi:serine hydrolase domain-containing protein [Streptomyces qinzhouensis]|uniref:Beta-lactamase family protein n=1 Tax=Streptomyces qinzhouensis TaxID=2599401 RepID=A0A5B8IGK8_9ACTN|nr:serine hydrolase domain-containing protein [Streptomyces qinzhouensis]QDY77668.1 beta-lactamase family protein [Streptomyces qinzhouensis]
MKHRTARIEQLMSQGVHDGVYPGAVWAVGDATGPHTHGAVGVLDPDEPAAPMLRDTVFDAASLTKVLAVWSCVGTFWEEGKLDLDAPLGTYWNEVDSHPIGAVTARQLLTHTAGVPLRAQLRSLYGTDPQDIRDGVLHEALHRPPGEAVEYTDRAALVLGFLAEHLSQRPLDRLSTERIWRPLEMESTRFGPLPTAIAARCAPTELDNETNIHLKGVAHDFSARLLGGVCGIAGVFTVLDDLVRFLRHLLNPAPATGRVGFGHRWIKESLRLQTGLLTPRRGFFWHPAPGTESAEDVWVHYGFTGTAMWISPERDRWAVLLTNKLRLTRDREPLAELRNGFRVVAFA